jgi:hypothetical protein
MDLIKAKSVFKNKWVFGTFMTINQLLSDDGEIIDIHPSSICQSTNLFSKDNELIYQNDLCKDDYGNLFKIERIGEQYVGRIVDTESNNGGATAAMVYMASGWTITGNVFDFDSKQSIKRYIILCERQMPILDEKQSIVYVNSGETVRFELYGHSREDVLEQLMKNSKIIDGPPVKILSIVPVSN